MSAPHIDAPARTDPVREDGAVPDLDVPAPAQPARREAGTVRRAVLWTAVALGALWWIAGVAGTLLDGQWAATAWWVLSGVNIAAAIVLTARRPEHPSVPWLVAIVGMFPLSDGVAVLIDAVRSVPGTAVASALIGAGGAMIGLFSSVAMAWVVGLFATGTARGRWERRVLSTAWLVFLVPIVMLLICPAVPTPSWAPGPATVKNPFYLGGVTISAPAAGAWQDNAGIIALLVGVAVLIARYRRAAVEERRPMRWLIIPIVIAMPIIVVALLADVSSGLSRGTGLYLIAGMFANLALIAVITLGILWPSGPASVTILRRTLVYGLLWGAIAVAFVAAGALVGVAAGTLMPVEWAVVIAMGAAIAFQPLRRRLERLADRWLFGIRPDARQLIVGLGETLAETDDLDALLPRIGAALQEGLDLEWARVRLVGGADEGDAADAVLTVPIEVDGERVGVLECGPQRVVGEPRPADLELIRTFAHQAGIAVRNVLLKEQLADQTAQLRASRARLVRAQEAERRRIERNIHDGVQQDLTALIGVAGHAQAQSARNPDVAADDLQTLQDGLQRVLADVRTLAQGIHPSMLTDRGLLAAVEALAARHPLPVVVRADAALRDLRLPAELEGAAYFTVAEAFANTLKHADASRIEAELSVGAGVLRLRVRDDGVGFDPAEVPRDGLAHLAERVAAVGGRLEVTASPGGGATVTAEFALRGGAS